MLPCFTRIDSLEYGHLSYGALTSYEHTNKSLTLLFALVSLPLR